MKHLINKCIAGTSFEIAKLWFTANVRHRISSFYDLQTIFVMKKALHKDSNCLDIGSHTGALLRWMLKFAPRGTHYAFEPIPSLYRELSKSFRKHLNVKVFDIALSDAEGQTSFQYVVSRPTYSGLKKKKLSQSKREDRSNHRQYGTVR